MKLSLIAAISENNVIGVKNTLPWHIPEDLKRFKKLTNGHPIIMGRKTYESIGRVLTNRTNIIVTRDKNHRVEGGIVTNSLESAIELAHKSPGSEEIFIIGGGQIFEQAIKQADRLYLTIVQTILDGDAFFPEYSEFKKIVSKQESSNDQYKYTFLTLEK